MALSPEYLHYYYNDIFTEFLIIDLPAQIVYLLKQIPVTFYVALATAIFTALATKVMLEYRNQCLDGNTDGKIFLTPFLDAQNEFDKEVDKMKKIIAEQTNLIYSDFSLYPVKISNRTVHKVRYEN